MRTTVFALILLFSLVSQASRLEPLTDEGLGRLLQDLQHVPLKTMVQEKINERDEGCIYAEAEIPVFDPNVQKVRGQLLYIVRPENKQVTQAILVVPTIHGRTILEERVAESLCKGGFAAVVADVNSIIQPEKLPAWDAEDNNHRAAIHSLRTAIDFIQMHPNFDHQRIGAMGFSLGAITTSMLMGVDDRLSGALIAAGGGNFPEILTTTKNRHMVKLRERRMEAMNIKTIGEYEKELHSRLQFDPIHFAKRVQKEKIMMMIVENDRQVPTPTQKQLWDAFDNPSAMLLKLGHVASIVRLVYLRMDEVNAFFNKRFSLVLVGP